MNTKETFFGDGILDGQRIYIEDLNKDGGPVPRQGHRLIRPV
jgi:hypothetical protein